ncbi:hypothetical protein RZS08_03430, partial [Arthrospira platensis SPKY1]|nr:hypothetical protein [Arthrospira platensis SPKY1]
GPRRRPGIVDVERRGHGPHAHAVHPRPERGGGLAHHDGPHADEAMSRAAWVIGAVRTARRIGRGALPLAALLAARPLVAQSWLTGCWERRAAGAVTREEWR